MGVTLLADGRRALTHFTGDDGIAWVEARVGDAGGVTQGRAVALSLRLGTDGEVSWYASTTWQGAGAFEIGGVARYTAKQGEFAHVQIYGGAAGVTLNAAVTGTGYVKGANTHAADITDPDIWAAITDSKAGAANDRDLWLLGQHYLAQTFCRSAGRLRDGDDPASASLLVDGHGRGFIDVTADDDVPTGTLVQIVPGAQGWSAPEVAGGALRDATADEVFAYGVVPVAPASDGATAACQVIGWVDSIDLRAAVTFTNANRGFQWTAGGNTVTPAADYGARTIAIADASGDKRRPRAFLCGRIFTA